MPKFREGHCIFPHKRNLYKHAYRDTPTPPPKLCSNLPPIWFLLDRNALRFSLHLSETVFLGVIMDENLNWTSEISHVVNQVSKCTGIIRNSSFYLSTKTLRTLYFSL